MATNSATEMTQPMDPTDFLDWVAEFSTNVLEAAETIVAGFTVIPTTEAATLGFEISTSRPPALEPGDQNVLLWAEINVVNQQDNVFDNNGTKVPFEVTFTTNLGRTFERTFLITVKQL